jgi:hypothetical protein
MAVVVLTGGIGLVVLAWAAWVRPQRRRAMVAFLAAGGLTFQALHMAEHIVQLGVWLWAPDRPPFLTAWAEAGRDQLAVGGHTALGDELLHLGGNLVFLLGLVALAALVGWRHRVPSLSVALVVQGLHVIEHIALTSSLLAVGRSIGVTTLFGALDPGPGLWGTRVIAHFGLNTAASAATAVALVHLVARGRTRRTASQLDQEPTVARRAQDSTVNARGVDGPGSHA